MILYTIYSINLWLAEKLGSFGDIAFTEEQEVAFPCFRVVWGEQREANVRPRGVLSGARFTIYCVASHDLAHLARRIASVALTTLRSAGTGFTIPRYFYPRESEDEPIDYIALRDITSRELHLPDHPELAVHVVQATALALNLPVS
ncbi:MAG: hypothetical protein DRI48_06465 [Chloroflexi bacterium]|nr:MAG: hypothetical protein DRI48_06465 [Chloroflexota bacterium]